MNYFLLIKACYHPPEKEILEICEHVQKQAERHDSQVSFQHYCSDQIQPARPPTVQRMKADAGTRRIKYRCGQEVIQVYEHGEQQQQRNHLPALWKKPPRYEHRKHQMQKIMDYCP